LPDTRLAAEFFAGLIDQRAAFVQIAPGKRFLNSLGGSAQLFGANRDCGIQTSAYFCLDFRDEPV